MTARGRRPKTKAAADYHHGDLRQALLDAAIVLMTEEGIAALSLRELARRIGVTYGAPHHHFPEKVELFAAIAEEGFAALIARVQERLVAAPDAPAERLRIVGRTYLDFATTETVRYAVMFLPELRDRERFRALHATGGRALELLAAGFEATGVPRATAPARAVACWSTLHGFAMLVNQGFLDERWPPIERLTREVVETATR